ncbi:MAG: DUF2971 domain-containing protein [Candidatus Entotheonellia bacterium]
MILYKYVLYEAGRKIIAGNSIGFAGASDFNDPFELTGYPREEAANPVLQFITNIRADAKRGIWIRNSAILCLTRSPLNPLMWAHYAEAHRGFVIGFDVNVSGFTATDMNLLPAQFGSMIYTEQKPRHKLVISALMEVGGEMSYRPELLEKLQRLFLHKPLCWSYEEEVRIVRCVKGIEHAAELPSGTFTLLALSDRQLYLLALPDDAIREVYLGVRNPIIDQGEIQSFAAEMHKQHANARLLRCVVGEAEWTLESKEVGLWRRTALRSDVSCKATVGQTC